MLSPALCVVRPGCSGLAGKSLGAVLGGEPPLPCSPRLYALFGPSAPALPEGARVKSWVASRHSHALPGFMRCSAQVLRPCRKKPGCSPGWRAATPMLSPALCVIRPECSGLAGRGQGEVLGGEPPLPCSPRLYALFGPGAPALPEKAWVQSWPNAAGQRKAPLVQRGDSMAKPCRGDCKARQMIQLGAVIGCGSTAWPSRHGTGSTAWVRRLAVNPSVGVRRQLPLHKGAVFAFLHRACQLHNKKLPLMEELFLWRWARIALWLLPGDGLSHPEQEGKQRILTGDRNGCGGTPPSRC